MSIAITFRLSELLDFHFWVTWSPWCRFSNFTPPGLCPAQHFLVFHGRPVNAISQVEVYVFMSYELLGKAINYSWFLQRGRKTQWTQNEVGKVNGKCASGTPFPAARFPYITLVFREVGKMCTYKPHRSKDRSQHYHLTDGVVQSLGFCW